MSSSAARVRLHPQCVALAFWWRAGVRSMELFKSLLSARLKFEIGPEETLARPTACRSLIARVSQRAGDGRRAPLASLADRHARRSPGEVRRQEVQSTGKSYMVACMLPGVSADTLQLRVSLVHLAKAARLAWRQTCHGLTGCMPRHARAARTPARRRCCCSASSSTSLRAAPQGLLQLQPASCAWLARASSNPAIRAPASCAGCPPGTPRPIPPDCVAAACRKVHCTSSRAGQGHARAAPERQTAVAARPTRRSRNRALLEAAGRPATCASIRRRSNSHACARCAYPPAPLLQLAPRSPSLARISSRAACGLAASGSGSGDARACQASTRPRTRRMGLRTAPRRA